VVGYSLRKTWNQAKYTVAGSSRSSKRWVAPVFGAALHAEALLRVS
jgi:hypothetical protein